MTLDEVMNLPASTDNNVIYDELFKTVTSDDIKTGTDPDLFSYAHLIEWAVRNKKYEEYYSYIKKHKDEKNVEQILIDNMVILVRFSVAGEPLFGFLTDYDGESALMFPDKKEMRCVFL
jgi:hypothetical protein